MISQKEREFINQITIKLTNYEEERRKRLSNFILTEIITLAITYISYKGCLFFISKDIGFLILICGLSMLFAPIFFFANIFATNKEFKQFLKQQCQKNILKTFNLDTIKGTEFSEEELVKSNLFSRFNRLEFDDVIQGKHHDVDYTIAEATLISRGRKKSFTIFEGVIVSFKSNKKIEAETLVTSKGDANIRNYPAVIKFQISLLIIPGILLPFVFSVIVFFKFIIPASGILPEIFSSSFIITNLISFILYFALPLSIISIFLYVYHVQKKKMQDVKLESALFEKQFNVYTKNQVEARYLLSPAFMDRLQNLRTAFGTQKIKCSFFDDQIMFAISTRKDLFELGSLFKPLSSNSDVEKFYKELSSVQQMIDHFRLSQKTGL